MDTIERPEIVEDEHLDYLDEIRESGIVNMFGARPYLMNAFEMSDDDARTILLYWMKTFGERHAED